MTRISVRWGGSELAGPLIRSEEHTSELQSQSNLVCRLLLEKKKTTRAPASKLPALRQLLTRLSLHAARPDWHASSEVSTPTLCRLPRSLLAIVTYSLVLSS